MEYEDNVQRLNHVKESKKELTNDERRNKSKQERKQERKQEKVKATWLDEQRDAD